MASVDDGVPHVGLEQAAVSVVPGSVVVPVEQPQGGGRSGAGECVGQRAVVDLEPSAQHVHVVQPRIAHDAVLEADAAKSAVHGGSAKVGDSAAPHDEVVGFAVGHAVAADAQAAVAYPGVLDFGPGAALNKNSAQKSAPLAGDVPVKRLQAVALEHDRILERTGVGRINAERASRCHPEPRSLVEVHARPGGNRQGSSAVDHRVAIYHVGLVVAPHLLSAKHHVGYEQVGKGLGLVDGEHAVRVVKVGVPGERHQVDVLAVAALLYEQRILPKHFAVAPRSGGFDENPNAVAGGNHDVLEVGAGLAVGVEAERGFRPPAQVNPAEVDVVGAGVDQAHAAGGTAHRRKDRVEVDRVLAARQGHGLRSKPVFGPAGGQCRQGDQKGEQALHVNGKGRNPRACLGRLGRELCNKSRASNSSAENFVHLPSAKNGDRAKTRSKTTKR